jgi:hypothetical protein
MNTSLLRYDFECYATKLRKAGSWGVKNKEVEGEGPIENKSAKVAAKPSTAREAERSFIL